MKFSNMLIPLTSILIGVGCQSRQPQTVSHTSITTQRQVTETSAPEPAPPVALTVAESKPISVQQVVTDKATYTIEVLPNSSPKLTPTSREGDKADHVYSSNIIAVYVHTNGSVTATSTNATAVPAPVNAPQP